MSLLQLAAGGGAPPVTAIEDVFSAYTYTGNGGTQTITNGVDLAGKGGLVWMKNRGAAYNNSLTDTVRGAANFVYTDLTNANNNTGTSAYFNSFTSSGFVLAADAVGYTNGSGQNFGSWSFAQAAKFFKVAQVTVSGSNQTVDLSSLGTVGMVTVKRTDSTSAWYTFHRSCTSGKLVYLNTTAAETTDGSITLSGTTLTLVQSVIGNGTYIVYAWAHDTGADGLIQCGSSVMDGSTGNATVSLGWEPQYILVKKLGGASNWFLMDTARGYNMSADNVLKANTTEADASFDIGNPTATGFYLYVGDPSATYAYLAIRRGPMKKPTVGTQVYYAEAVAQTNAQQTTGVPFPTDLACVVSRDGSSRTSYYNTFIFLDRLRGMYIPNDTYVSTGPALQSSTTAAEDTTQGYFQLKSDSKNVTRGTGWGGASEGNLCYWFFRRYPGVFDEVCYTGTGSARTVAHNLTVTPELMIVKARSGAYNWGVYSATLGATKYLMLNSDGGNYSPTTTPWNDTPPTASVFTVGTWNATNESPINYVAYLFATLAGISKVFSYTGNGSSQTINCGFTTGARFILIKRTDSTGDWYLWDSTRGIVAGNDPHLSVNTTVAEVTTDDSIDPDNSGFIVNEVAATHCNVNAATYIGLAFA